MFTVLGTIPSDNSSIKKKMSTEHCWKETDRGKPNYSNDSLLVPLCSSQIPDRVAWDWTRASNMTGRQLTAWIWTMNITQFPPHIHHKHKPVRAVGPDRFAVLQSQKTRDKSTCVTQSY